MSYFLDATEQMFEDLLEAKFVERHEILARLFDLNVMINGRTLLHRALEKEDIHLIVALLRFGADANMRSGHILVLPLGVALNQGREDFIQILIAFGARVDYLKSDLESTSIESEIIKGNYRYFLKDKILPS